ncbi:MAG TPA: acyltransferase [Fimbriimonadaceae bacterium]
MESKYLSILRYDVGVALRKTWKACLRPPVAEPRRYPNFDILRIVAAASVFVMHINNNVAGKNPAIAKWGGLFFAVPLFLAISGFLVLKSFADTASWPRFLWKRCCRVAPAWVTSLTLVAIVFGIGQFTECVKVWATLGLTFGHGAQPLVNGPIWSLGWEELYYAALALLFLGGAYRKPIIIWALAVVSLVLAWAFSDGMTELHRAAMIALPSSFFIGNLVYIYRTNILRLKPPLTVGALVIAITANLFRPDGLSNQFLLQAGLIISCLIFAVAGPNLGRLRFPDLSYGVYIYHAPIIALFIDRFGSGRLALGSATLALLVPLTLVSWYFIEKPALTLKNVSWPLFKPAARRQAVPLEPGGGPFEG